MSASLQILSLLTVLAGFLTLLAMIRFEAHARRREMNLLKVLGARKRTVALFFVTEYAAIAGLSAGIGTLSAVILSRILMAKIFESTAEVPVSVPVFIFLAAVAFSALLAWFAARRVWRENPMQALSSI